MRLSRVLLYNRGAELWYPSPASHPPKLSFPNAFLSLYGGVSRLGPGPLITFQN